MTVYLIAMPAFLCVFFLSYMIHRFRKQVEKQFVENVCKDLKEDHILRHEDGTPVTLKEYIEKQLPLIKKQGPFKPVAYYWETGDFLEFYASDAACYAERLCDYCDVLRDQETKEVVGIKLGGVSRLLSNATITQIKPPGPEKFIQVLAVDPTVKGGDK